MEKHDVSIALAVRASMFPSNPPKNTLWQASTEDQLRNFGMPSFVTARQTIRQETAEELASVVFSPEIATL